ncbi:MAG: hypothetical protein HEQ38_15985 [Gemmatimonas sp.]|nr:hypothetical protein [Gemmatimonas sp.]
MTSSRTLLVAAGCLGIGAAVIALGRPVQERPAASVLAAGPRVSVAARWRTKTDTIRRGEPLSVALERAGLAPEEAAEALSAASALDPRKVRAGTTITTKVDPDSGASEVVLQLAIDRVVRFTRSVGQGWTEKEEKLQWTTDTVVVGGVVTSTLTAAVADGADAFPERQRTELAYALADILEYRVDLSRDLQKNDSVRVMVERQTAPNGLVRPGNIIAARLTVAGKPVETMRFTQGHAGVVLRRGRQVHARRVPAGAVGVPSNFQRVRTASPSHSSARCAATREWTTPPPRARQCVRWATAA